MEIRDRITDFRRVPASQLIPNPLNWRRHPAAQQDALKGVLEGIGFADAVIARETPVGLELIDGHLRADVMGDDEVPVLVVDLNADEALQLLLTLDPLAMMAEKDDDAVAALLAQVSFEDEAVLSMLESLDMAPPPPPKPVVDDPGPQLDIVGELAARWETALGQLWQIGPHRLLCADITDPATLQRLCGDTVATMAWSDPPYGVDYGQHANEKWGKHAPITNDALPPLKLAEFWQKAYTNLAKHVSGDLYIASPSGPLLRLLDNTIEETPWERHQWLTWVKDRLVLGRSNYHYRHEQIWYGWLKKSKSSWAGGRNKDSVMEVPRPSRSDEHPTMKPVELVAQMLNNSCARGDVVIDPFIGSGTTMVAAEQLERVCYATEIEPGYVAVTLERLAGMGLEPKLVDDA
tara:strand:+ start:1261 stop:2478 length:1218 start_codon:yes stop_codon:yes gene_type:complete